MFNLFNLIFFRRLAGSFNLALSCQRSGNTHYACAWNVSRKAGDKLVELWGVNLHNRCKRFIVNQIDSRITLTARFYADYLCCVLTVQRRPAVWTLRAMGARDNCAPNNLKPLAPMGQSRGPRYSTAVTVSQRDVRLLCPWRQRDLAYGMYLVYLLCAFSSSMLCHKYTNLHRSRKSPNGEPVRKFL